jgi:hypothetical protein
MTSTTDPAAYGEQPGFLGAKPTRSTGCAKSEHRIGAAAPSRTLPKHRPTGIDDGKIVAWACLSQKT